MHTLPKYRKIKIAGFVINRLEEFLVRADHDLFANTTRDSEGTSILNHHFHPKKGHYPAKGPTGGLFLTATRSGTVIEVKPPHIPPYSKHRPHKNTFLRYDLDHAIDPVYYHTLVEELSRLSVKDRQEITIFYCTPMQPNLALHAQLEILARKLEHEKLLSRGGLVSFFGAPLHDFAQQELHKIGHLEAFSRNPGNAQNFIHQQYIHLDDAPLGVQRILKNANVPAAVVSRQESASYITGYQNIEHDFSATAAVMAMRNARIVDYIDRVPHARGQLWTTNSGVGPHLFAEAMQTNIHEIITVKMPPHLAHRQYGQKTEAPNITDEKLRAVVARGYHDPRGHVRFIRSNRINQETLNESRKLFHEVLKINHCDHALKAEQVQESQTAPLSHHIAQRFSAPRLHHFSRAAL